MWEKASGPGGLEVFFHQAQRFDQRNWIPQVEEEGLLTVSVPFWKLFITSFDLSFQIIISKNVLKNDSVQHGLSCIDCHTSVLFYACTDKILKFNKNDIK